MSVGTSCVAVAEELSAAEPRIKVPSCEAAAAIEMVTKERTSFMMIGDADMIVFVDMVCLEDKFVVAMIMLVNLWPAMVLSERRGEIFGIL